MNQSLTQLDSAGIPAVVCHQSVLDRLDWTGDLAQVAERRSEHATQGNLTDWGGWELSAHGASSSRAEENLATKTDSSAEADVRLIQNYPVDYVANWARVSRELASGYTNILSALQVPLVPYHGLEQALGKWAQGGVEAVQVLNRLLASQFDCARVFQESFAQYSKSADMALKSVSELSNRIVAQQRSVSEVMSRISRDAWQAQLSAPLEVLRNLFAHQPSDAAVSHAIQRLLEQGRIHQARATLVWALSNRPESEVLARWRRVLAPARARLTGQATGRSRQREQAWLREHAPEYQGQWVALDGDRLLAAGSKLAEVRERARATGRLAQALLHFVPAEA